MTHGAWAGVPHVSSPQCSTSSREAEGLHRRALEGGESQLGAQHPDTLVWVNNLALVLKRQGKLEEAGLRSLGLGARRGCGSVEGKAVLAWPGQGTGEFLVSKFHRSDLKVLFMRSLILHVGLVLVSLLWKLMSHSIVAGEFDEMTPQDAGQASRTCQGRKLMKLFLRNPSFVCRYQIGPNSFDWVVGSQQQYMHFVQG